MRLLDFIRTLDVGVDREVLKNTSVPSGRSMSKLKVKLQKPTPQ